MLQEEPLKNRFGASIRTVLVVLMAATAAMTLLGAVGTSCLAWNGDKYGPAFRWIVPYMTHYQILVYIKLVVGSAAVILAYATARGERWFYLGALITLIAGGSAGAYQMYMSSTLRDISFFAVAPTNVRVYITVVTLIAYALVRFPGIWNKAGLGSQNSRPGSPMTAGGIALVVSGVLILTTPLWVGETHMLDGYNLVYTLELPLLLDGTLLVLGGLSMLFGRRLLARLTAQRAASIIAK